MMQLLYGKSDVYAYQLLHYFITRKQYQMVRIQNQKKDFWLMNANHSKYPVICISVEGYNESNIEEDYLRNVQRAILDIINREGKLLILNTNSLSTSFEKEYLQQIHVDSGTVHQTISSEFNDIHTVIHDVEDGQIECANLMRSLEEYEAQTKRRGMTKVKVRIPRLTAAISIICFVYFLLVQGAMLYFQDMATGIIASGGYYKMSVVAMNENWRIFTSGLLHYDVFHLFVNIYGLFSIGLLCEKLYKPTHYILIFLLSLWVGNLFAFIADSNIVSVGMSGGIFGLSAAFAVVLLENGSIRLPMVKSSLFRLLFLDFLIAMMPNTSLIANIGAVVTGGFLGVMFIQSKRWKSLTLNTTISFIVLLGCLGFFAAKVQRVEPIDKEMDNSLIQGFEKAGWTDYAKRLKANFELIYEREM